MVFGADPRASRFGQSVGEPGPDSEGEIESTLSILASLLSRFPLAKVAAIDESGIAIPVPESVPLAKGHTAIESTLDLVIDKDRATVATLYARARICGTATEKLHLKEDPDHAVTVHAIDCRTVHGAIIVVSADGMDVGSGNAIEWALPPLPARLARAHKDGAANFTAVDSAMCEILGWSADELIGRRALEIVHPDDHDTAIANWVEMLATPGLGRRVRLRHRHRDGHWAWLEITNQNRLDDPLHGDVVAEMVDISEEMAAHEALEAREQLLHELAETVPLGLFHSDTEGNIHFANERLSTILRIPRAESVDDVLSAIDPADRPATEYAVHQVMSGLGGADLEVRILSTGTVRYGALSLRAPAHETAGFSGFIGCLEDVTEAVTMRQRMEVQARFDALTECHNRASTMDAIAERTRDLAPGSSAGVAVLYVDLDRFKPVNDAYGHAIGDQILRITAQRLRHAVRSEDIVGRIGGDEFVVVCSHVASAAAADQLAETLRAHLCEPADIAGRQIDLSASVGVAWTDDPMSEVDALVDAADSAMYESKRSQIPSAGSESLAVATGR
jgi:diguanylate cyclase (GGDEF)-like protein/PAS domain S-box-containing protein